MKKHTRIFALAGAVLLIALYLFTLIFALIDTPLTEDLLKISIAATILIPVLLYGYLLISRISRKDQDDVSEK